MPYSGKYADDQPYAHVKFACDSEEREVPAHFISDFKPELLEKFDKTKRYYVFHSNDEKDTPDEAKKRINKIPVIKRGEESQEFGYYQASIMFLEGSKKKLLEAKKKFRSRRPAPKLMEDTSFSDSLDKDKAPKKKGLKRTGQGSSSKKGSSSRQGLKEALAKNVTELVDEGDLKSENETEVDNHDTSEKHKLFSINGRNKGLNFESIRDKVKNVTEMKTRGRKRKSSPSSESSSSSSEPEGVLSSDDDASYVSPRKFRELKTNLLKANGDIKRLADLNRKLQERLFAAEEENEKLKDDRETAQMKTSLPLMSPPKINWETDNGGPQSPAKPSFSQTPTTKPKSPLTETLSSEHDLSFTAEETEGARSKDKDRVGSQSNLLKKAEPKTNPNLSMETSQKETKEKRADNDADGKPSADGNAKEEPKPYTVTPYCILSPEEFTSLGNTHYGEKGDSMFVKIIGCRVFSKKGLRTHSVSGRPDPKRSKKEGPPTVPKPPLKSSLLTAVRDCLVEKLLREKVSDPKGHSRCAQSKVNRYLKDRAKTLAPKDDESPEEYEAFLKLYDSVE